MLSEIAPDLWTLDWRVPHCEGVVFPNGCVSRLYRWLTRDKVAARAAVATVMRWNPRRILLCHGEPFTDDVSSVLEREFSYLR